MSRAIGPAIREAHAHGATPWDIARAFHLSITVVRTHLHGEGHWRARAACADADPALFFPEESAGPQTAAEAKRVCARCPVTAECLEYALDTGQRYGVWGGLTANQRTRTQGGV